MTEALQIECDNGRIRRIRANNPSPLTGTGTNSYVIGTGEVAVIDPGPELESHLAAILSVLEPGERITQILVTHSHLDHSALVPAVKRETDATVFAFGDSRAGKSEHMKPLTGLGGGEGVDHAFTPDVTLEDGSKLKIGEHEIIAIWTPGHFGNHLCFGWGNTLFSGDLVMGWATSLVSPPDGDLTAFMASLARLQAHRHATYLPGHGEPVSNPQARLQELIDHRNMRETQILAQLANGPATAAELTHAIYTDVPPHLHPAAARNVLAHLIDLTQKNKAHHEGSLTSESVFWRR